MSSLQTAFPRSCLAAACLAAGLPAQSTWIVDSKTRAGAQFSQLQPAIDAASAGDILIIRDGLYVGAVVTKGLQIHAQPGAIINLAPLFQPTTPGLDVANIPAGERVVIKGLTLRAGILPFPLKITDCAGFVHVEDVTLDGPTGGTTVGPPALIVRNSARVTLTRCQVDGRTADLVQSTVCASECTFRGNDEGPAGLLILGAGYGLRVVGGDVELAACAVASGRSSALPARPAMHTTNGLVTLGAGTTITASSSSAGALTGSGRIIADPGVAVAASAPITITRRAAPTLGMLPAVRGGRIGGRLMGAPREAFLLLIGFPAPPTRLPFGTVGIAPTGVGAAFSGVLDSGGRATWFLGARLPANPRGAVLSWQALVTNGQGIAITNVVDQVVE